MAEQIKGLDEMLTMLEQVGTANARLIAQEIRKCITEQEVEGYMSSFWRAMQLAIEEIDRLMGWITFYQNQRALAYPHTELANPNLEKLQAPGCHERIPGKIAKQYKHTEE